VKRTIQSFFNILHIDCNDYLDKTWAKKLADKYMELYNIKYRNDGTKLDKTIGCVQEMASKALRNVRKRVF
jgi:hypothetical protein